MSEQANITSNDGDTVDKINFLVATDSSNTVSDTLPSVYVPAYNKTVKTDIKDPFSIEYLTARRAFSVPRQNFFGMENLGMSRGELAYTVLQQTRGIVGGSWSLVQDARRFAQSTGTSAYNWGVSSLKQNIVKKEREVAIFKLNRDKNDNKKRYEKSEITEEEFKKNDGEINKKIEELKNNAWIKTEAIRLSFAKAEQESISAIEELRQRQKESLKNSGFDQDVDRDGFGYQLASGFGSLAAGVGASLIGGPYAGGVLFAMSQWQNNADEAISAGASREKAHWLGLATALPGYVLETAGIEGFLRPVFNKGLINRAVGNILSEGSEEFTQNLEEDAVMVVAGVRNKTVQKILSDAVVAGIIGCITATPFGVARAKYDIRKSKLEKLKSELNKAVQETKEATVPDVGQDTQETVQEVKNVTVPDVPQETKKITVPFLQLEIAADTTDKLINAGVSDIAARQMAEAAIIEANNIVAGVAPRLAINESTAKKLDEADDKQKRILEETIAKAESVTLEKRLIQEQKNELDTVYKDSYAYARNSNLNDQQATLYAKVMRMRIGMYSRYTGLSPFTILKRNKVGLNNQRIAGETVVAGQEQNLSTLSSASEQAGTVLEGQVFNQSMPERGGNVVDLTDVFADIDNSDKESVAEAIVNYLNSLVDTVMETSSKPLQIQILKGHIAHIIHSPVKLKGGKLKRQKSALLTLEKIINSAVEIQDEKYKGGKVDLTHNTNPKTIEHKKTLEGYVYFGTQVKIGGSVYTVKLTTERVKGQDKNILDLYNIDIKKGALQNVILERAPKISIQESNNNVNNQVSDQNNNVDNQKWKEGVNNPEYKGETINIDGKERSVYNSTGERIAKSEVALRNFYKWFGGSKVIDEQGRPLVVYHGTGEEFDTFDFGRARQSMDISGAYFSTSKVEALDYAGNSGKVYPVYLKIEKPADYETAYSYFKQHQKENYTGKVTRDYLLKQGYDGIFNDDEYVVLKNPTQIKSVNNSGAFSSDSANIFYQTLKQQGGLNNNTNRGSIQFNAPGYQRFDVFINLFKTADESTLPHELSHLFLLDMQNMIEVDIYGELKGLKEDLEAVLGKPDGGDNRYSVAQQEYFAEMYEKYLYDGLYPKGWRRIFVFFKNWLHRIYKTVDFRHEVTPEAKKLFDRWLSFDSDSHLLTTGEINAYNSKINALKEVIDGIKEYRSIVVDGVSISDIKKILYATQMNRPAILKADLIEVLKKTGINYATSGLDTEELKKAGIPNNVNAKNLRDILADEGFVFIEEKSPESLVKARTEAEEVAKKALSGETVYRLSDMDNAENNRLYDGMLALVDKLTTGQREVERILDNITDMEQKGIRNIVDNRPIVNEKVDTADRITSGEFVDVNIPTPANPNREYIFRSRNSENIKEGGAFQQDNIFKADETLAKQVKKDLNDYFSNTLPIWKYIELGLPNIALKSVGIPNYKLTLKQNIIYKSSIGKHNVKKETFYNLPDLLSDPLLILKSDTVANSFVIVLNDTDSNGYPVIAIIDPDNTVSINEVDSIYGKENKKWFKNQIENGNLLYIDEKRALKESSRLYMHGVPYKTHNQSVLTKEDIVNPQIKSVNNSGAYSSDTGNVYYQPGKNMRLEDVEKLVFAVDERSKVKFKNDVKRVLQDKSIFDKQTVDMGKMPILYVKLGLKDEELKTNKLALKKGLGLLTEKELSANKNLHNHNVPEDVMYNLPALIADPVAVFKSNTVTGSYVAVLDAMSDEKPIIVAISPSRKKGSYTLIPSVYERNNYLYFVQATAKKGNVVYTDKERKSGSGTLTQAALANLNFLENSILTKDDIVKAYADENNILLLDKIFTKDEINYFDNKYAGLTKEELDDINTDIKVISREIEKKRAEYYSGKAKEYADEEIDRIGKEIDNAKTIEEVAKIVDKNNGVDIYEFAEDEDVKIDTLSDIKNFAKERFLDNDTWQNFKDSFEEKHHLNDIEIDKEFELSEKESFDKLYELQDKIENKFNARRGLIEEVAKRFGWEKQRISKSHISDSVYFTLKKGDKTLKIRLSDHKDVSVNSPHDSDITLFYYDKPSINAEELAGVLINNDTGAGEQGKGIAVDNPRKAEDGWETLNQSAKHVSRSNFKQFNLAHVGEGEGVQVHGYGLYFAKDAKVIQNFVDKFSQDNSNIDVRTQVYTVDIPENYDLLDEQKTFNEQPKRIQKRLREAVDDLTDEQLGGVSREDFLRDITEVDADGGKIYAGFSNLLGSDKKASEYLHRHGIKGITYDGKIDGQCFVIFEPADIIIEETLWQGENGNNDNYELVNRIDKSKYLTDEEVMAVEANAKRFKEYVGKSIDKTLSPRSQLIILDKLPSAYNNIKELKGKKLVISQEIYKKIIDLPNRYDKNHNVERKRAIMLPYLVADPNYIVKSNAEGHEDRFIVITNSGNGRPAERLSVILQPNTDVAVVSGYYEVVNISEEKKAGRVVYDKKKELSKTIVTSEATAIDNSYTKSIQTKNNDVNGKGEELLQQSEQSDSVDKATPKKEYKHARDHFAYGFRSTSKDPLARQKIDAVIDEIIDVINHSIMDPKIKEETLSTLRSAKGHKDYLTKIKKAQELVDKAVELVNNPPKQNKPEVTPEKEKAVLDMWNDPKQQAEIEHKAGLDKNPTWSWVIAGLKDLGQSVTDRVGSISPRLKKAFREFTQKFNLTRSKHNLKLAPFIKAYSEMSEDDRHLFDYYALNNNQEKINKLANKYPHLANSLTGFRETMGEIYIKAAEVGFDIGFISDYFPRRVKNYEAFITYLKGTDEWTNIQRYVANKLNITDPDHWMTIPEHMETFAYWANQYMNTGGNGKGVMRPGNTKARKIFEVTPDMTYLYYNTADAVIMYASEIDRAIAAREFFGYDKQNEDDTIGMLVMSMVEDRKAQHEDDPSVKLLTFEDEKELRTSVQAFLHPRGPNSVMQAIKDWGYMATLVSPISSITQLEDLAVSFVENEIGNTFKAMTGEKITLEDIGASVYDADINTSKGLQKALNRSLDKVYFSNFDRFSKETFILADYYKRVKQVKNDLQGFIADCVSYGYNEQEITEMINELRTEDTKQINQMKSLLFYDLAEVQPLDLAEMPVGYLRGGNWRIAYALKTFTLKRLNYLVQKTNKYISNGFGRLFKLRKYR